MNNEWIFDNPSATKLQALVRQNEPGLDLNFDVTKIKWRIFVQNHAYGIKKYILYEETYMPSMGYADARTLMFNPKISRLLTPWKMKDIYHKRVIPFEETKKIVFGSEWVRREIELLVKKRMEDGSKKKKGSPRKFSVDQESEARAEVEDMASKMLKRIFSDYTMPRLETLMFFL